MTTTPTVQQCDRDAAALWYEARSERTLALRARNGTCTLAQAFAAHRESATAPLIELLREARKGLREIAGQMRPDEMDKITRDNADFDDGYDACVAKARISLAKLDKALTP